MGEDAYQNKSLEQLPRAHPNRSCSSPLTAQKHLERAHRTLGVHTLSEMVRRGRVSGEAVNYWEKI
jgi:hypothetical protein